MLYFQAHNFWCCLQMFAGLGKHRIAKLWTTYASWLTVFLGNTPLVRCSNKHYLLVAAVFWNHNMVTPLSFEPCLFNNTGNTKIYWLIDWLILPTTHCTLKEDSIRTTNTKKGVKKHKQGKYVMFKWWQNADNLAAERSIKDVVMTK